MECKFYPGQRVACVDDDFDGFEKLVLTPKKGSIYTIREVYPVTGVTGIKVVLVRLKEIVNPIEDWDNGRMEVGFLPRRFRPLVTRKTDISVFTAMLNTQRTGVPA